MRVSIDTTTGNPVTTLTSEHHFCLRGCGSYRQYYIMRRRFQSGSCPFCEVDRLFNKILFENEGWMLWEVPFNNKKGVALHLLLVPKQHIRFPWELGRQDWLDEQRAWEWLHRELKDQLPGGIVASRFGSMELNAGTVPHFHHNIMVPDCQAELRIPVWKNEEYIEANRARMREYTARYESGEVPEE